MKENYLLGQFSPTPNLHVGNGQLFMTFIAIISRLVMHRAVIWIYVKHKFRSCLYLYGNV